MTTIGKEIGKQTLGSRRRKGLDNGSFCAEKCVHFFIYYRILDAVLTSCLDREKTINYQTHFKDCFQASCLCLTGAKTKTSEISPRKHPISNVYMS